MCQLSVVESKSATFPSEKARHLLDDSVLESRSPRRGPALTSSSAVTNGLSLGKRLAARQHGTASVCSCLSVTVLHPVASPRREGSLRSHPARGSASWPLGVLKCLGLSSSCGPEHSKQVEEAARHTPETHCPWRTAGRAWPLPCRALSWESHRPQPQGKVGRLP